jgi:hypothetical protein
VIVEMIGNCEGYDIILHKLKEAGNLPQCDAHRLDDVPGQYLADVIKKLC